jgi:PAS domain S-box-containing protein
VTSGGLRAPATLTLFVAVVLAGQLLGPGGALSVAGIGSAGTLSVFELYREGHLARPLLHTEGQYARALVVQLLGTGGLIAITAWSLSETMRRLRREQAAFRDLVEEAPDAMASLDAEGRIIQVNRAHEKLVGRSREELLGAPFDQDRAALSDPGRRAGALRGAEIRQAHPSVSLRARAPGRHQRLRGSERPRRAPRERHRGRGLGDPGRERAGVGGEAAAGAGRAAAGSA